jgi:predicted PurR-regulated permease PerM
VLVSALVVAGVWLSINVLFQLRGLLLLLLASLFISFAMEPAISRLTARGWRRGRAAGLVLAVTGVVVALLAWLFGRLMVGQVRELVVEVPDLTERTAQLIDERFDTDLQHTDVVAQLASAQGPIATLGREAAGDVVGIGASLFGLFLQLLSLVLFTYYFAKDGPRLRRWLSDLLPAERRQRMTVLSEIAIQRAGAYLAYRVILAACSSVAHTLAFVALDLPSPVALGVWVGLISQFVPTVGTYLAATLPLLVAIPEGLTPFLVVLAFIVIYQQVENYLLAPRLSAATLHIHPAVGFGSVLAGAALFGPVGAVLAQPVVAVLQGFAATFTKGEDTQRRSAVDGGAATDGPQP